MMGAIVLLFSCACLGEAMVSIVNVPVPGPIAGMAILMTSKGVATGAVNREIERLFDLVAPHIPLFFIPSAVGFVAHLDLMVSKWLAIAIAVLIGTVLAIAIAGIVFKAFVSLQVKESLA